MSLIRFLGIYFEFELGWIPHNTFDNKSTLVQVMAWCRQATDHNLGNVIPYLFLYIASLGPKSIATLWRKYMQYICTDLGNVSAIVR